MVIINTDAIMPSIKKAGTVNISNITIGLMLIVSMLVGVLPSIVAAAIILACCAVLFFLDDLYLAYPFMIFYYHLYGMFLGLSVYRWFTLIFIIAVLFKVNKKTRIDKKYFLPLVVYLLYMAIVVSSYDAQRPIFGFLNILCCVLLVALYIDNSPENLRKFFAVYVFVAIVAFITGIINDNTLIEGNEYTMVEISRFHATFEDPNYMGFFYTIAVFVTASLGLFRPVWRWTVIVLLNIMIMSTVSMTAIVVNVILWLLYFALSKKIKLSATIAGVAVVVLLVGLYEYGLNHSSAPVLGDTSYRIQQKLIEWREGDLSGFTTGRTDHAIAHFKCFLDQPFWKKLFGGTPVNSGYIANEVYATAHNEYIDMLLNVGIIGTFIMVWFILKNTVTHFSEYIKSNSDISFCRLMCNFVWISYAFTLTIFTDFRFILPFFI